MLFLVDEDLATDIAQIGRRFGLDVAFNRGHGEAPTEYLLIFLHREDA